MSSVSFDGLPDAAGPYEIIVRLDDGDRNSWKRVETAELSVECLVLSIDVMDPNESEDLSLYYAVDPECPTVTTTEQSTSVN